MKSLLVFIFSIVLLTNCSAQNEHDSLSINYNAATRGSKITIVAKTYEIIYTTNLETKNSTLSKKQWSEIKELVLQIELSAISNLEAPSNESYTDRALIGSLTIIKNNETYESSTFDHGNPPKELKELINKLFEFVN